MTSSIVQRHVPLSGNALRNILERTTHRLVIKRQLPSPFAKVRLFTSSEGGLRYLRPSLKRVDPTLLQLASEVVKPGHTVWDIGANLGLFSFAAAALAGPSGHVLAIEPDATLVTLLRRSAAINPSCAPVEVLPVAVAASLTISRFHIALRNRSTNYLDGFGTTQTGGVRATDLVPTTTLDWLATHFPLPDVIKIDVEGAEVEVLAAATDALAKSPMIICEVAESNASNIADMLTSHGYRFYDGELSSRHRSPLREAAPPTTIAISKTPEARTSQPA
jgi:FkbM family methyltransferase